MTGRLARLAPATFLVLWSAGFAFVALGLPDSEPITFLALRYAIVVAVLVPAFLVLRPPLPQGRRDWLDLIVVGFCCRPPISPSVALAVTLPPALVFEGFPVQWTGDLAISLAYLVFANSLMSITLLLMMFFLVPPLAALIAWAVLGESLPALAWLGMAVAAVGVAIASSNFARGSS